MNKITLTQVNIKKPTTISILAQVFGDICEEFLNDESKNRLGQYFSCFSSASFLKERIKLDNYNYFVINKNGKNIGLIEYLIEQESVLITHFLILNNLFTKKDYKEIFDILSKTNPKIRINVNQKFKELNSDLICAGFKFLSSQIKYFGDNFFVGEDVLEYKR